MKEPNFKGFLNEMVAGDSGGEPEKVASGVTTGAVVNKGPSVLIKKKQKKDKGE